jgi:hypothetical protein
VSANKGTSQYHIDAADNGSNTPGPLPHLFFSVVRERPVVVRIAGRSPLDGDAMPQNIDKHLNPPIFSHAMTFQNFTFCNSKE